MFDRLSYFFRNYFGFSKSESRGSIILIIILFFAIILPVVIRLSMGKELQDGDLVVVNEPWLDSLSMALAANNPPPENSFGKDGSTFSGTTEGETKEIRLFKFNPNTATEEEFIKLGLQDWLAARIIKYRSKGGQFREKSDLSKIYGMPDEQFRALRPYIDLPEKSEKPKFAPKTYAKEKNTGFDEVDSTKQALSKAYAAVTFPVDINLADSIQLKALRGVGSKTAAKILDKRRTLGGFISLTQLEEIWGISDEALDELESKTFVDKSFKPQGIKINTASPEEIWEHPYLKRYQARAIVAYRTQHGAFKKIEDLSAIKVINAETLQKIAPYIDFLEEENDPQS